MWKQDNDHCGSRKIPAGLNQYSISRTLRNRITLTLSKGDTVSQELEVSERSAAWLAHYTGGVGVGGSNPLAPTI